MKRAIFLILSLLLLASCGGGTPRHPQTMPAHRERKEPARMWTTFAPKGSLNLAVKAGDPLSVVIPTDGTIDLAGRPLYVLPLRLSNIEQGNVRADCHFLSVLAGLALQRPELVGYLFREVDAEHVSGDFYQPVFNGKGIPISLNKTTVIVERRSVPGGAASGLDGSTWVANAERCLLAYLNQNNAAFDWSLADYGNPGYDLNLLGFNIRGVASSLDAGALRTLSLALVSREIGTIITTADATALIPHHCYTITSVNERARTITLWNVWGFPFNGNPAASDGTITISADVAAKNIHDIYLSDGTLWAVPSNLSPTDPRSIGAPPRPSPVLP